MFEIFILFLAMEAAMLIAACIYVSPMIGARDRRAPPVTIAPLPAAIARPTAKRRGTWSEP